MCSMRATVAMGLGVACFATVVSACGTSSHSVGSPVPTSRPIARAVLLTRVLGATNRIRSYQFVAPMDYETTDGGGGAHGVISGVTDVAAHRTEMTVALSNSTTRQTTVFAESRAFNRISGPAPVGHDWCWTEPKTNRDGPDVSLNATLADLAERGRSVREIGSSDVRGVPTTHYVVTGGTASPVDIWVDRSDQLRRIHWKQTGPTSVQTTTEDLFDFDAPVRIDVPMHAPACSY